MRGGRPATAVVGCGAWGSNLVRAFSRHGALAVCCDRDGEVLEEMGASYPEAGLVEDFGDVLSDPAVEAVAVVTPTPEHAEMAIRALEAGKHVFVEKPIALASEDAERVVEAAEAADRVLQVGHLMEYHPAVRDLKGLVDAGELGDLHYLYSVRVNLGKVRENENALWSLAPHDVSMMLYLVGEEPEEVAAHGESFLRSGVEDVAFLYLRFPSGVVGHVHISWLDPHKERRLTVVGDQKMAVFDDMAPREKLRVYDKGADVERGLFGGSPAGQVYLRDGDIHVPAFDQTEPLMLEVGEFLRCVEEGERPLADGRDGLRVVRVLERAQERLGSTGWGRDG